MRIFKILLAIVLGKIVSYECEIKGPSVGFRTHILVRCPSSSFTEQYKLNIHMDYLISQVIQDIGKVEPVIYGPKFQV